MVERAGPWGMADTMMEPREVMERLQEEQGAFRSGILSAVVN